MKRTERARKRDERCESQPRPTEQQGIDAKTVLSIDSSKIQKTVGASVPAFDCWICVFVLRHLLMAAVQELGEREAGDHVSWGWEVQVIKSWAGRGGIGCTDQLLCRNNLLGPLLLHSHAHAQAISSKPFPVCSPVSFSDAAGSSRYAHATRLEPPDYQRQDSDTSNFA